VLGALRSAIVPQVEGEYIITTDLRESQKSPGPEIYFHRIVISASAMPLLEHNITANQHLFSSTRPRATILDWDDEGLPDYIQALNQGFDAIVYVARNL